MCVGVGLAADTQEDAGGIVVWGFELGEDAPDGDAGGSRKPVVGFGEVDGVGGGGGGEWEDERPDRVAELGGKGEEW